MILDKSFQYPKIKGIFTRKNIMSQVILKQTAKKINLSVASNIMKQINSKLGGDSVRMKMPSFVADDKVMVIGIDVCHAGKKSVVGFTASKNASLTQYYSDIIIQPKFQEIVKKDLDRCLSSSIDAFQKENNGELPGRIFIFRDGVGEGMRDQIIDNEVKQFKESLKTIYKQGGIPPITLVVVNKRINQRMFVKGSDGKNIENPPPGSIIDSKLVENQTGNTCFDFFLVPQQTTQGCVTPTHFFVAMNESADVSKQDIEDLSYTLCYMYSNWSGSIKVPAPCQYAHKIAEYHYSFDQNHQIKKTGKVDLKQLCYNKDFLENFYYL
jgi:aubergine